jgi:predicted transposase/invertase (TIGR01784 family)
MPGDHDIGYKQIFAHRELVRDLLSGFTSFECFRDLDPSAFERVNASYVSEQFSERHGDMVWRVQMADQVLYVYLLLEFQSQAERWMALRMQVYVGLLYQDLVKRGELAPDTRLPPVLPVVFYNGVAPWNASGELRELVAPGPSELAAFQASQRYLLIDQRSIDPAELARSRTIMSALFRIELFRSPRVLNEVGATLRAWLRGPEQAALRRSIAGWITRVLNREFTEVTLDEVEGMLEDQTMGERIVSKYATYTDEIKDQGLQQGLARGRNEGRQEGLKEGLEEGLEEGRRKLREVLKRQIAKRFGDIPAAITARIDAASEDELERWSERIVDAGRQEDVFAD